MQTAKTDNIAKAGNMIYQTDWNSVLVIYSSILFFITIIFIF